ncbi:MAG: T9SS type A sorting domain-containing protein, partial [Bacteroidota bacterium]
LSGGATVCADANDCANIYASPNGDAHVPAGFEVLYVLTSGEGLVIQNVNASPEFEVCDDGLFTIHTLVYDPATLDLSIVVPGVTTGVDVFGLITDGGGDICASLDVAGAPFIIENPHAGALSSEEYHICLEDGCASLNASPSGGKNIPEGYAELFVLTSGTGLVIEQVNSSPEFTVCEEGLYTIHTLIFNPSTLDLSIVVPGVTTGVDVLGLISEGGGDICASLDVSGAGFMVEECADCSEAPEGLESTPFGGGVLLSWNPIPGSIACQIKGGPEGGTDPYIFNINGFEPSQKLIPNCPDGDFQWKVRCACSFFPMIVSDFSEYDYFTVSNFSDEPATRIDASNDNYLSVYPVPNNGNFTLETNMKNYTVELIDISGKIVWSQADNDENQIAIEGLNVENGMYTLRLFDLESTISKRIIINR